jgi:hypothetical protein
MPEEIPYAPIRKIIGTTLLADPELSPTPFHGGVWNRHPQAGKGESVTPGAWYGPENPDEAGRLKPTISVIASGGDLPSPNAEAIYGLDGFVLVHAYVPLHKIAGVPAIANMSGDEMLARLERKLHHHFPLRSGKWYNLGDGSGVNIRTLESLGVVDADDLGYAGRQRAMWRIQGTYVRNP